MLSATRSGMDDYYELALTSYTLEQLAIRFVEWNPGIILDSMEEEVGLRTADWGSEVLTLVMGMVKVTELLVLLPIG